MLGSIATVSLLGLAPMTQSHQHTAPKLQGENPEDYDIRTWRCKLNAETPDGGELVLTNEPIDAKLVRVDKNPMDASVVIPAHGFHQALAAGAKYSKRQIPNQGRSTWTAKFTAGIMMMDSPWLNIDPNDCNSVTISANVDGVRGSGKRVPRRLPLIPKGWTTTFEVAILDPIITEQVFLEMIELTGMFIGIGQFRPEKGGINGRFAPASIAWEDNRELIKVDEFKRAARQFRRAA